ncbi:MAG: hypothetical protein QMD14_04445 [Candidatus Aenigmarchaeota archaeon]|nr:hypothetical protein [Candidatus Aenigmarchaeota archaeon]
MKYILFVCRANSGRSQMAQALFNTFKKSYGIVDENYEAMSAGINPASRVGSTSLKVMKEIGIDMSNPSIYYPKRLDKEIINKATKIIYLNTEIGTSDLHGHAMYEIWDVEDTYHKDEETIRRIRDDIRAKCLELVEGLYHIEMNI